MMIIKVNGEQRSVDEGVLLPDLLDMLGLSGKPVVVERNKVAVLPREYQSVKLEDGDVLEIVVIAAGG